MKNCVWTLCAALFTCDITAKRGKCLGRHLLLRLWRFQTVCILLISNTSTVRLKAALDIPARHASLDLEFPFLSWQVVSIFLFVFSPSVCSKRESNVYIFFSFKLLILLHSASSLNIWKMAIKFLGTTVVLLIVQRWKDAAAS